MKHFPTAVVTAMVLPLTLLLSGCAGDSEVRVDESENTLQALIDDGLANAKSDFQKEVLNKAQKSGEISEADWKEANEQYKSCLIDAGQDVELVYEGSQVLVKGEVNEGGEPGDDEAQQREHEEDAECYEKTSMYINEIYAYLNDDGSEQNHEEVERAVYDCLIETGVIPKDTTFDEFSSELSKDEGPQISNEETPVDEQAECWEKVT